MTKLAIVCSHPIQYYTPWFRYLAHTFSLKVFFLWNRNTGYDHGFQKHIDWDIDLLSGYESCFVENVSSDPGTHHWSGLDNPTLAAELKCFGPDAVLVFGYNYKSLNALLLGWDTRSIPLLFRGDSHLLSPLGGLSSCAKHYFRSLVFGRFSAFLFVGQANKEYFLRHGVKEERLFFSPHSIDNARFIQSSSDAVARATQMRDEFGIDFQDTVLLFSGKFERKKRPLDLLASWKNLNQEQVTLVFVGAGELEAELKSAASLLPKVHFLPFQNQSQMPAVYALADLVVLPSFGPYETWGLTINEAMCMSRPCVVSSHVGCHFDLIKPGETGFVFEAGDVEALTEVLRDAVSDLERLKRLGAAAFQHIQQYDYAASTRGLESALAFALTRRQTDE